MVKTAKRVFPVLFMFFIITLFHFTRCNFLKYYPVIANFSFFTMFFITSFMQETAIQRIAKTLNPDLSPQALDYTRKLNYLWALFTFCNFLISLYTVFLPEKIWAVYNGCISYMLVGTFLLTEYIYRQEFKKKYDCQMF